jgi:hypothetical protein
VSQSIRSDRISESTIARMAGNIASNDAAEAWLVGGTHRRAAVQAAVATARDIARQVECTQPDPHLLSGADAKAFIADATAEEAGPAQPGAQQAPPPDTAAHVLELSPSDAYKLGWHDAKADEGAGPRYSVEDLASWISPLRGASEMAGPGGTFKVPLVRSGAEPGERDLPLNGKLSTFALASERAPDPPDGGATPERQARDLLLRLGVAGDWSSGDLVELANLFAENRHLNQTVAVERDEVVRLQRARIGDAETAGRLMSEVEGLKSEVQRLTAEAADLRQRLLVPDPALTVPVEVCLGCGAQTHVRGDCGCPAGTGTREVRAISEAEYRQKAKAVRAALLGPGMPDAGHPPTAEMARSLRTSHDKLLEEVRVLREQLGPRVDELKAQLADALHQIEALKGLRPDERRIAATAAASALRRSAEEIENSLRTPVVSDRQLLLNCLNWYWAQAANLDPLPGAELSGQNAAINTRLQSGVCPTCTSPDRARHPAMQHEGEVQPCGDPWHGVPRDAHAPEVDAARTWTGRKDGAQ